MLQARLRKRDMRSLLLACCMAQALRTKLWRFHTGDEKVLRYKLDVAADPTFIPAERFEVADGGTSNCDAAK